jgi:hypothetical protein
MPSAGGIEANLNYDHMCTLMNKGGRYLIEKLVPLEIPVDFEIDL